MAEYESAQTARARVRRHPERASYDPAVINSILDDALICHVGVDVEGPVVIPMTFGRDGDKLFLHGSKKSRLMQTLCQGARVCIVVTEVDGIVAARSAFHHSLNYRSVVLLGEAVEIEGSSAKIHALRVITNHVIPNRWHEVRPPDDQELRATAVVAVRVSEASAKIRSGPPAAATRPAEHDIWAGVIPIHRVALTAVSDDGAAPEEQVPESVSEFIEESRRRITPS